MAEENTGLPDDGTRAPDDSTGAPDDSTRAPDGGTRAPDDGTGTPLASAETAEQNVAVADASTSPGERLAEIAGVRLLPGATRFVLRGGEQALAAAAAALELPEPDGACRASTGAGRALLWLGPDERLILAPEDEADSLIARLGAALTMSHSLVDVSHRQLALEVSGPAAAMLINCGCPLDLHPRAFPVDTCTRTVLNRAEIVLWRTADASFRIEVSRSFARYVTRLLADAEEETLT